MKKLYLFLVILTVLFQVEANVGGEHSITGQSLDFRLIAGLRLSARTLKSSVRIRYAVSGRSTRQHPQVPPSGDAFMVSDSQTSELMVFPFRLTPRLLIAFPPILPCLEDDLCLSNLLERQRSFRYRYRQRCNLTHQS